MSDLGCLWLTLLNKLALQRFKVKHLDCFGCLRLTLADFGCLMS